MTRPVLLAMAPVWWTLGLGSTVKRAAGRPADGLIALAQREGITHVVFGQSPRSRWELPAKVSTLNRFLQEVKDAAVQVRPL